MGHLHMAMHPRDEQPATQPQPQLQSAVLSYVSHQCKRSKHKKGSKQQPHGSSLTRSQHRQPSLVEGQPQYDSLDEAGVACGPQQRAIINMEDVNHRNGTYDDLSSYATTRTAGTSSDASLRHNNHQGRRHNQQLRCSSSTSFGQWLDKKHQPLDREGSSTSMSTDHAECLRWSMRSLSSTNTLQTMATTTATSQSASCSPSFSVATSIASRHKKASRKTVKQSLSVSNTITTASGTTEYLGWYNMFQSCFQNSTVNTCQCGSKLDVSKPPMEQAIPEDQPATVPSDESNLTTPTTTTLLSSCLTAPGWLAQLLTPYKRAAAFDYDGETDTVAELEERIANLRHLVKHCDSEETNTTDSEDHDRQNSLCPSRSEVSCSTSSVCSSCPSASACATAAGSMQDMSSFCTSGPGSVIVDRTPDQVWMDGEVETADLDREQAEIFCLDIPSIDVNVSEDVSAEVSPIGLSFVSQFKGETAVKTADVVEEVREEEAESEAPKTPEQVAAECHFGQALNYERSSYLDEALTSLHDALRCCNSSKIPLPLLQCRIQHSTSVVEWKLGQYHVAIQTLQWCVEKLTTLLFTSEASSFKTNLEETLLLSESHRQLAVVYMSLGSSHSKQSIAQLQLSLQVCRSKMTELKKEKKARRKQFSSQVLHSIAHSLTVLGSVYKEKGKYAKAVGLYQRGLHILVQQEAASPPAQQKLSEEQNQSMMTYRSNSALIAHTLNHMGEVFQFQYGDSHKAMDMYSEALWLYRVCLGHQHVDVAMTMLHMGQVHMEWQEYLEAKEAFGEALKVFEIVLGSNHRNVATTLWYMAQLQVLEQNFGQALEYFEECLDIQRKCLGDYHSDVSATYHAMAQLYEKSQQPQHALQLYNYAWQVNKRNVGQEHSDSLAVAKDITRVQGLYQRQEQEQLFAMR